MELSNGDDQDTIGGYLARRKRLFCFHVMHCITTSIRTSRAKLSDVLDGKAQVPKKATPVAGEGSDRQTVCVIELFFKFYLAMGQY